jgi:2-oxoglutarate ferredoxin oxidoreductase subunit beta
MQLLEEANRNQWLLTGLIYIDPDEPTIVDIHNLVEEPLNRLPESRLRPAPETMARINEMMF